jgi:hypothetical protein
MKCNICGKETENELCIKCSKELKDEFENIQEEEYNYVIRNSVYRNI